MRGKRGADSVRDGDSVRGMGAGYPPVEEFAIKHAKNASQFRSFRNNLELIKTGQPYK